MSEEVIKDINIETPKKSKNYCLFLFEIAASIFITFIHIRFPSPYGEFIVYLARFGVPLFFMISGFYLVPDGTTNPIELRNRIKKKLIRIVILLGISSTIYFLYGFFSSITDLSSFFINRWNLFNFINFILFNSPFLNVPHWFLLALIYVYLIILCFPKLFLGKDIWLILISLILFITITLHILSYRVDASIFGCQLPDGIHFRNWFFNALPFISLGVLLKRKIKYLESLNLGLVIALLVFSMVAQVGELYLYNSVLHMNIEFGVFTIPLCSLILVLSVKTPMPSLGKYKILATKGNWTTFVYILHPLFISVVSSICSVTTFDQYALCAHLKPILVVIITIPIAILFNYLFNLIYNSKTNHSDKPNLC